MDKKKCFPIQFEFKNSDFDKNKFALGRPSHIIRNSPVHLKSGTLGIGNLFYVYSNVMILWCREKGVSQIMTVDDLGRSIIQ